MAVSPARFLDLPCIGSLRTSVDGTAALLISIEVFTEYLPRTHPKVSYQLAAVQQPPLSGCRNLNSNLTFESLRPSPTFLAVVARCTSE